MIDLELLADATQWAQHCERQQQQHPIAPIQVIWHGRIDLQVADLMLQEQSHYEDRHGTGVLADREINPTAAVLDRAVIAPDHPAHGHILSVCGLAEARVAVNLQRPGCFIPDHVDRNRTFIRSIADRTPPLDWSSIRRFFYFFEDQAPGQFVQLGHTQIQWRAGDMIEWPYYLRHATANASYSARTMLSIVGV
jgi:hypothetical protein